MIEVWKDIVGYENMYQVSNLGNAKSLGRKIIDKNGVEYYRKPRAMKLFTNSWGYNFISVCKKGKSKFILLHRAVLNAFKGVSTLTVDHIDGNKFNNSLTNLEYVSNYENSIRYRSKLISSSIYMGVSFDKPRNKWRARITVGNKNLFIGRFNSELDASLAYQNAVKKYHTL